MFVCLPYTPEHPEKMKEHTMGWRILRKCAPRPSPLLHPHKYVCHCLAKSIFATCVTSEVVSMLRFEICECYLDTPICKDSLSCHNSHPNGSGVFLNDYVWHRIQIDIHIQTFDPYWWSCIQLLCVFVDLVVWYSHTQSSFHKSGCGKSRCFVLETLPSSHTIFLLSVFCISAFIS